MQSWHLGSEPQSLPTAHGFDEFYGIPPDLSWDSATYVDTIELTHSSDASRDVLLAKGPQIVEAALGGPRFACWSSISKNAKSIRMFSAHAPIRKTYPRWLQPPL